MFDPQDLSASLKDIAWRDREAIAFVVYYASIDSRNGKRKDNWFGMCRCIRVNNYGLWQIVNEDGKKERIPFMPDAVKLRHPEAAEAYANR